MPYVIVHTKDKPVKHELDGEDYMTALMGSDDSSLRRIWKETPGSTGLVEYFEDGELVKKCFFQVRTIMHGAPMPSEKSGKPSVLTSSQTAAYERLLALAACYFKPDLLKMMKLKIRPRFFPLIVGPTGVGKTTLAEAVSKQLGLKSVKISIASWIPTGARNGEPTLKLIEEALKDGSNIMLIIDELDKMTDDSGHSWTQSILGEVFETIDKASKSGRCFVVAAGAWQVLHDTKPSMGFAGKAPDHVTGDELVKRCGIPKELLLRLSTPALRLEYPSKEETAAILQETGLLEAAEALGCPIDPSTWSWQGGMRSLENKAAELCLIANEKSQTSIEP